MDRRIGAQYYTIREHCQTLDDFDASCQKVKDIGYQTVQLSGIGKFAAEEIKEILDKYGLEAVCTHRPAKNYLEHLEEEIAFHKTIGCKICGLGAMPGHNGKEETVEQFAADFKPVAEELSKHGLVFAYHNHAFEFEKRNGRYVFDTLIEKMGEENLQLILDVYWLAYAGINPAKFIREHQGQIACVHLKDLKMVGQESRFAEVGRGNLDWDEILLACEKAGVQYALVEQDTCEGDPFDSLKVSYHFLKSKGY